MTQRNLQTPIYQDCFNVEKNILFCYNELKYSFGGIMKFCTLIYNANGRDLSPISKYISTEKPIYALIEFDENDKNEVLSLMNEIHEMSLGTISCLGEDGYVYEVSMKAITKTSGRGSLRKSIRFLEQSQKKYNWYSQKLGCFLEKFSNTTSVEKFTVSRFKSRIFVSKEYNFAFYYRIKNSKKENQPLVVFIHGGGCIGCDNVKQLAEFYIDNPWSKLKKYDCNILLPQIPFSGNIIQYNLIETIKQLSEYIAKETKADKNRIYILGTSFGAHNTWSSAYNYSDYYACAMPVMGRMYSEDKMDYNKLKDIPLLIAHASDDKVVDVSRDDEMFEILKGISANIRYVRWDKYGHRMARKFYKRENWDEWMFSQSLDKR